MKRTITILLISWAITLYGWDCYAQGQYETANFIATAPTQEFAKKAAETAEFYRQQLAVEWIGSPLPGNWQDKCAIKCTVGQVGSGGYTTFAFNGGEVFGWDMAVQGSEQEIIDSVIPHEVNHTVFASHFRRPLPRWADEGAATLIESESERRRRGKTLKQILRGNQQIPVRQLLALREYPQNQFDVFALYAQGYALSDYLVRYKGKREFLAFLDTANQSGWDVAFRRHYGINDIGSLDSTLRTWVEVNDSTLLVLSQEPYRRSQTP